MTSSSCGIEPSMTQHPPPSRACNRIIRQLTETLDNCRCNELRQLSNSLRTDTDLALQELEELVERFRQQPLATDADTQLLTRLDEEILSADEEISLYALKVLEKSLEWCQEQLDSRDDDLDATVRLGFAREDIFKLCKVATNIKAYWNSISERRSGGQPFCKNRAIRHHPHERPATAVIALSRPSTSSDKPSTDPTTPGTPCTSIIDINNPAESILRAAGKHSRKAGLNAQLMNVLPQKLSALSRKQREALQESEVELWEYQAAMVKAMQKWWARRERLKAKKLASRVRTAEGDLVSVIEKEPQAGT